MDAQHAYYLLNNKVKSDVDIFQKFSGSLKESFGIHFIYAIIFKEEYYYLLFDDFDFITKFVLKIEHGCIFCREDTNAFCVDGYRLTVWPKHPLNENMQIYFDNGLWHGMTVFKANIHCTEIWGFMSDKSEDKQAWLITHQDFFLHYIRGFNNISAKLHIPKTFVENDLFHLPKGFKSIVDTQDHIIEHEVMQDILSNLKNNGVYIEAQGKAVKITPREWEVCSLLRRGFTAKLVANSLDVSTETVTTHIKNIKLKLERSSKSNILSLYDDRRYL